jgi:hypothetical protein
LIVDFFQQQKIPAISKQKARGGEPATRNGKPTKRKGGQDARNEEQEAGGGGEAARRGHQGTECVLRSRSPAAQNFSSPAL